ncbi:predicted protein [Botrytis cinerea T4]|uniref:Uncharacterized protein n=1 Tax=Botryotinia fuckeliana (strain T4) TaxID=999810 RepID=G2XWS1_BOTF4|nr:predicted protein [Botrytis cinerea T4]
MCNSPAIAWEINSCIHESMQGSRECFFTHTTRTDKSSDSLDKLALRSVYLLVFSDNRFICKIRF